MSNEKNIGDVHDNNNNTSTNNNDAIKLGDILWSEVMMDIRENGQYPFKELMTITNTRRETLLLLMLGNCNALSYQAGVKLLSIHQTLFPGKFVLDSIK
tara:strand:- start:2330 stop:2626 length:297 start_codon:yes stop_codon:yes gene_type:complete